MIEIPLTKGQIALIDDEDADLAELKWFAVFNPTYANGGNYIARRNKPAINGKRGAETMHRVILSRMLGRPLLRSEEVDHIHGNPLDNRRSELRLATHPQNMMNQKKRKHNKSGFKGVTAKPSGRWMATIGVNYKKIYLGMFDTKEDAYTAYCQKAHELYGEFADVLDVKKAR